MNTNHYLTAFELYHREHRDASWTDALDIHFQRGAVLNVPDFFAMLRPVSSSWPDNWHLDLRRDAPGSRLWHVWCVVGDAQAMIKMAHGYGVDWVSYQRHGKPSLHRLNIGRMFN